MVFLLGRGVPAASVLRAIAKSYWSLRFGAAGP
jgi:hypothetical protein